MSNTINVGNAKLILRLPESTMLITSWNALWSIWRPTSDQAMVIYMPNNTAIVSDDPATTVAVPGSEPMIVLAVNVHCGATSDTPGTNSAGRARGHRQTIVENHNILSKIDGTAHFIYPHEESGRMNVVRWLCGSTYPSTVSIGPRPATGTLHSALFKRPPPQPKNSIDLSLYPSFKLSDLVGEKEFKKLASKAKSRFRKIMK